MIIQRFSIAVILLLFSLTPIYSETATVSWDANTESDLSGYKIYYGTSSGNYDDVLDVGNTTSFTINNLTVGTTYFFSVTAYDFSANESGFSIEVSHTPVTSTIDSSLTVAPSNPGVSNSAGSTTFTIISNVNWTAEDNVDWLNVTPTSGSGNLTLTATFSINTSINSRIATIIVSGGGITREVKVTQLGTSPELIVTPLSHTVSSDSGSTTFNIISNVNWTAEDNTDWLSANQTTGSGSLTLTVTYSINTSINSRIATITVNSANITRAVTITQNSPEDNSPADSTIIVVSLRQNYPNPMLAHTTIKFILKKPHEISLHIFNITGELIKILISTSNRSLSEYSVMWNGKDQNGNLVASGVYIYTLLFRPIEDALEVSLRQNRISKKLIILR